MTKEVRSIRMIAISIEIDIHALIYRETIVLALDLTRRNLLENWKILTLIHIDQCQILHSLIDNDLSIKTVSPSSIERITRTYTEISQIQPSGGIWCFPDGNSFVQMR